MKPPVPKSSPMTQQILPNSSFSMPSFCISSYLSSGLFVLGCTRVPDISFSSRVRSSKRYLTQRLSSEPYRSLLGRLCPSVAVVGHEGLTPRRRRGGRTSGRGAHPPLAGGGPPEQGAPPPRPGPRHR